MGEILPQFPVLMQVSNDQRHDAALTLTELSDYNPSTAGELLLMVGLAARDEVGRLRPDGVDEFDLSWFTPRVRPASVQ
jgi:hypothetical protein